MTSHIKFNFNDRISSRSDTYYRILQELGAGGNAVVYLVIAGNKSKKGVIFALKVFTRITKGERIERFYKETEFLRNDCEHPSIMRVFDEGVHKQKEKDKWVDYPFVIAEYLPDTMSNFINKSVDMVDRVSFCLQLLSALSYLDSRSDKVIHRDIKPQNIFVKGQSCVLGDFGLMKFVDDDSSKDIEFYKESTSHGMPFYYRSPDLVEYAKGNAELTTKSDVFQLGLVFAEIFTGKNPEMRTENITDPITLKDLDEIPSNKGKQIGELITNMLEFDPANRPSAVDIIDTWDGIFREIADLSYQLNGRVF